MGGAENPQAPSWGSVGDHPRHQRRPSGPTQNSSFPGGGGGLEGGQQQQQQQQHPSFGELILPRGFDQMDASSGMIGEGSKRGLTDDSPATVSREREQSFTALHDDNGGSDIPGRSTNGTDRFDSFGIIPDRAFSNFGDNLGPSESQDRQDFDRMDSIDEGVREGREDRGFVSKSITSTITSFPEPEFGGFSASGHNRRASAGFTPSEARPSHQRRQRRNSLGGPNASTEFSTASAPEPLKKLDLPQQSANRSAGASIPTDGDMGYGHAVPDSDVQHTVELFQAHHHSPKQKRGKRRASIGHAVSPPQNQNHHHVPAGFTAMGNTAVWDDKEDSGPYKPGGKKAHALQMRRSSIGNSSTDSGISGTSGPGSHVEMKPTVRSSIGHVSVSSTEMKPTVRASIGHNSGHSVRSRARAIDAAAGGQSTTTGTDSSNGQLDRVELYRQQKQRRASVGHAPPAYRTFGNRTHHQDSGSVTEIPRGSGHGPQSNAAAAAANGGLSQSLHDKPAEKTGLMGNFEIDDDTVRRLVREKMNKSQSRGRGARPVGAAYQQRAQDDDSASSSVDVSDGDSFAGDDTDSHDDDKVGLDMSENSEAAEEDELVEQKQKSDKSKKKSKRREKSPEKSPKKKHDSSDNGDSKKKEKVSKSSSKKKVDGEEKPKKRSSSKSRLAEHPSSPKQRSKSKSAEDSDERGRRGHRSTKKREGSVGLDGGKSSRHSSSSLHDNGEGEGGGRRSSSKFSRRKSDTSDDNNNKKGLRSRSSRSKLADAEHEIEKAESEEKPKGLRSRRSRSKLADAATDESAEDKPKKSRSSRSKLTESSDPNSNGEKEKPSPRTSRSKSAPRRKRLGTRKDEQ